MLLVGGATPAGPRARDPRRYKVCGSTFASCVRLRDPRGARAAAGDVLYLLPDRLCSQTQSSCDTSHGAISNISYNVGVNVSCVVTRKEVSVGVASGNAPRRRAP